MKYNLKNNAQKIHDQLLQNPKPNNAASVHGSTAHRPDQPSLSTSIAASSSSTCASSFNCDDTYSGPVMLDFDLQTVRHAPYEYSDFNKQSCKIIARQLRARHAAPSNQTPAPLPNFFSTHRLKRANVTNNFDKLTHKRRKSAKNTNEDSNAIAKKSVVEAYLHSTSETNVDTNQTGFGLFDHLPQPATTTSDAGESSHISDKSCLKRAWKNTKPATNVTTRPAQRYLSPSGLQISSASAVYNRSQQPHSHATEGTPDTNTYLPPNVPTSDDGQSSHINNKRKLAADVTTRRVQQCLSTSGSQSTSANGLYNRSEQQDFHATKGTPDSNSSFLTNAKKKRPTSRVAADTGSSVHNSGQQSNPHQSEDESPVYEDLGDCNERCRYCNVAFWHEERLKGHREAKYHLCCGGDPEVVQGLIEFLDTHNELVQVFRTARDKCAENDVPGFKVRLYNGNGARGYELPTSQPIGAIVFDSGPTTETDYDIIIEISYKVNVTIGGSKGEDATGFDERVLHVPTAPKA
ncbi:hypothetical protein CTI12_AA055470 [Artemisia annua]|uniref:C2H2-type domain-containing protein n=1 Tax=Artemisia annua TaxID=35608 RepID=A0A2U1QA88_ARTAN|nr:hypothetical protein CTI12_AA055470 [Artemisia annua]